MVSQNSSMQRMRQWGIMGAILFILPKCPLCILALLSMGSGIGLTAAQASSLQGYLLIVLLTIAVIAAQRIYSPLSILQVPQNILPYSFPVIIMTVMVSLFIFQSFFDGQLLHVNYYGSRIVFSCPALK